ncbi:MAG: energy transducer TonB [Bacteroidales bacterium]|nr:energy transducer TonB [Bacteroidales bacterium]MBD5216960.1 energy transducer TonB [Bacteroidales bacterium]
MAKKNVDLTSQEWRDMVFADKNKEFGAYQLRKESAKRHNMAVLFTLIGLVVVGILIFGYSKYAAYQDEQKRLALQEQAEKMSQIAMEQAQEETPEEQPEEQKFEQPKVEVKEEVLATVQETQIAIVEKDKVKNEVRDTETKQEDNTARGVVNQEGSDEVDRVKAVKEQVVVKEPEPAPEPKKAEPEQIFTAVEQQAQYPGGQGALMKFLSSNIRYPESAQQNDIQGRVIVKFVVEKDGSIGQAQVVKGVDRALDQEALRVVKKMPRWQPGKNNGVAVRSWFTLPVTFRLQQQ